jgi:hypothetical protein
MVKLWPADAEDPKIGGQVVAGSNPANPTSTNADTETVGGPQKPPPTRVFSKSASVSEPFAPNAHTKLKKLVHERKALYHHIIRVLQMLIIARYCAELRDARQEAHDRGE